MCSIRYYESDVMALLSRDTARCASFGPSAVVVASSVRGAADPEFVEFRPDLILRKAELELRPR